jgi:aspartyl-tRNA(Asn)/glutamyl-tRNA(Gln) amidotransferase subunit B
LPQLPWERFNRYTTAYGLNVKQATQLVDNPPLAQFFDDVVDASSHPQQSTNFVLGELSRLANETQTAVHESPVTPAALAELIALVEGKTINSKIAKELLERMWNGEGSPKALVEREGLAQTSDPGAVMKFIDEVLSANEKSVTDYKAGKTNVMGFLVGQVMKVSRGKADPQLVNQLVKQKLES